MKFEGGDQSNLKPGQPMVRLRGLPYAAEEDDIRKFLEPEVIAGYIHFTYTNEGRASGECFVQVENEDAVQKAQEKNQKNMGSRYIEVFTVTDSERDALVRRIQSKKVNEDAGAIRARGLPFSCKTDDLDTFFKGLPVLEVIFGKEPGDWGRPTGEAYIRFGTKEEAERAMELNGQYLGKRYIELFRVDYDAFENFRAKMDRQYDRPGRPRPLAQVDHQPWGPPHPPRGYYGGGGPPQGGYGGGGGGGYGNYDPYAYQRTGPPARPAYDRGGYGGAPGGYNDPYAQGGYPPEPYPPHHGGGGYGQNLYGGGGEVVTPNKVHVRGLPYRVPYQQILEFFSPLQPIEIKVGVFEDGRASGDGIIEFANEHDAMESLKKDRESIKNRYIEIFPHDQAKLPSSTTYKSIFRAGGGGGGHHPPAHHPAPPAGYGAAATWRY